MADLSGERHERVYCHACGGVWVKDDDSDGLTCRYCESDFTEIIEIPPDNDSSAPTIPNAALEEDNTDNTADNYGMLSLASPYTSTLTDERPTYTHHTYRSPDGRFTFNTTTTTVRGGTARGLSFSNRSTNARGNAGMQSSSPPLYRTMLQQQMELQPGTRPRENASTQTNSPPLYHAMAQQQMEMETGTRPRPHYFPPDVPPGFDRAHLSGESGGIPQRTWDYYQVPPDNILRFLMGMPLDSDQPGSHSTEVPWDIPMTPMRLLQAVMNRGNAVYTDEEMQQVIANLTDEGPVIPAPGAPSIAIQSLPRKRMDRQMLGWDESSECSICMEKVGLGSEVTVLPCSHWFHFDCIEQWLAQTNTCPHCRRSIPTSDSDTGSTNRSPRGEGTRESPVVIQDSPEPENPRRRRRSSPLSLSGRSSFSRSNRNPQAPASPDPNISSTRRSSGSSRNEGSRGGFPAWIWSRLGGGSN